MKKTRLREWLEMGLNPTEKRLHRKIIQHLNQLFSPELREEKDRKILTHHEIQIDLIRLMLRWVDDEIKALDRLQHDFDIFLEAYANAVSLKEEQQHVLFFAKKLGATKRQLIGDKRAFSRWFGDEAITERFHRLSSEKGRDVAFILSQLGVLSAYVLSQVKAADLDALWQRLWLEKHLTPLLEYQQFEPIRVAAFHGLMEILHSLPAGLHDYHVSDDTLRYVYRCALDRMQDVWLQSEALRLLSVISPASFQDVIIKRLLKPIGGDDLFVRRKIVRLMGDNIDLIDRENELILLILVDPSPAVRQILLSSLVTSPVDMIETCLMPLACADEVLEVRGSAVLSCLDFIARDDCRQMIQDCLTQVLSEETHKLVLRVALEVVSQGFYRLSDHSEQQADCWQNQLMPLVVSLHETATEISVRRHAARIIEQVWMRDDELAWLLSQEMQLLIAKLPEGKQVPLPKTLIPSLSDPRFGRVLSCLSQQDFGFDVKLNGRPQITRGHKFGFRSWRFLHEFRFPSTDKRQAFRHTTGRIFKGNLSVPSGILAELALTKVPGEPLFMLNENDWRPYLPIVDELISALDLPLNESRLTLVSSEGVTHVILPNSFRKRLVARTKLVFHFAHYADLRNWREDSGQSADQYLTELGQLGFQFEFEGHDMGIDVPVSVDKKVTQFFPAFLPMGFLPNMTADWLVKPKEYFFSLYENTIEQLILFIVLAGGWFVGRQIYMTWLIKKARKAMPLVIGGWGTRGKSGTERLKAALFNALGYNVVSKTSGCEAMFVYGYAHGSLREMFLFRPYDKATIWEQANVLRLATKLNGEVFLWECMGLTPSYIEILQQQWMKDDLSTITNTYPDHEDLQGPAGINIPQVMTQFIPPKSVLVTSEEQMLPILSDAAKRQGTKLRTIDWMDAGLFAPDLLSRFPYEEHPYNIALVLEMAAELDIDADFAMKEMADRVVADLGVLKVSPVTSIKGRKLEFTNGMSANERFGCMANWQRMGYQTQDPDKEPAVWLSVVVNNRADRVSRSKVFSNMLVNELMTDFNVLIGTNLDGLQSYIRDDWNEYESNLTLWVASVGGKAIDTPLDVFREAAKRLRLLITRESIENELTSLLSNLQVTANHVSDLLDDPDSLQGLYGDQIIEIDRLILHLHDRMLVLAEYDELAAKLMDSPAQDQALDQAFKQCIEKWLYKKFIVIEDVYATGEEIIAEIVKATPPGIYNRVMGVQNIKGTGLDFIYRWQAWGLCYDACEDLRNENPSIAKEGLQALSSMKDFGSLSEEYVLETLDIARLSADAQTERFQAGFNTIKNNLDAALSTIGQAKQNDNSWAWLEKVINLVEAFSDTGDAVTRRKKANQIYRDMEHERISHAQAALELQALNKRQKGGWLMKKLMG